MSVCRQACAHRFCAASERVPPLPCTCFACTAGGRGQLPTAVAAQQSAAAAAAALSAPAGGPPGLGTTRASKDSRSSCTPHTAQPAATDSAGAVLQLGSLQYWHGQQRSLAASASPAAPSLSAPSAAMDGHDQAAAMGAEHAPGACSSVEASCAALGPLPAAGSRTAPHQDADAENDAAMGEADRGALPGAAAVAAEGPAEEPAAPAAGEGPAPQPQCLRSGSSFLNQEFMRCAQALRSARDATVHMAVD
jgi:hypothetical protein